MAERAARIRLMLNSGSFLGGMSQVGDTVDSLGRRLRNVLSHSAKAGLSAFGSSVRTTVGQITGIAGQVAGLAGGFSVGASAKEAIDLQHQYRNLAQQVNRLVDSGKSWRDIQAIIEGTADRTGQSVQKVIPAFREIYTATGDLKYTVAAIESIGTAATGSGEEIGLLANPMQLAARKFGISADQTNEAVARIIEKVGVGGASLDGMNARFANMAGEAADAGMRGTEGLSQLLGVMLTLDSRVGEKASMGLKAMFQTLKSGSSQLKTLEKSSGLKFTADEGAFDKIRKLVATDKGRKAAEVTFTAEARVVYDQLATPFAQAYKAAKDAGKSTKAATAEGLKAYDRALSDMTKSNADFSKLQKQANERLKEDPSVKIRHAMDKLAMEFTKPKMLKAIDTLADALPKIAGGTAKALQFLMDHPVAGAAAVIGGRAAIAGASTFALSFGKAGLVAAGAGIAKAFVAAAAASGGGWMGMGKLIGGGLVAAGVGAIIGQQIAKAMLDAQEEENRGGEVTAATGMALAGGTDAEAQRAALEKLKVERNRLQQIQDSGGTITDKLFGGMAAIGNSMGAISDEDFASSTSRTAKDLDYTNEAIKSLEEALSRGADGGDRVGKTFERLARSAETVNRSLERMHNVSSNGLPPQGSKRPGYSGEF